MKKLFLLLIFNAILLANVGVIKDFRGNVEILRNSNTYNATSNFILQENDKILTKNNGKAQIVFKDNTVVTLGRNSILEINKYLINGANSSVKLNAKRGSYEVISGEISRLAQKNFEFQAKTASIGIRGTKFAGNLDDDFIDCTRGEIEVKVGGKIYNVKEGNRIHYKNVGMIKIQKLKPVDFYMIRLGDDSGVKKLIEQEKQYKR